jgi:NAD(P)H-dependent FMN reductase
VSGLSTLLRIGMLDGSLSGSGNTAALLDQFQMHLEQLGKDFKREVEIVRVPLCTTPTADVLNVISKTDALVFATGTYWDSWGSPLQRFLEEATETECSALWLGKPAAVLVSAHSVGGKGILSRLQGVLTTFGCWVPPLCGWYFTAANRLALDQTPSSARLQELQEDLWSTADLAIVAHNLLVALRIQPPTDPYKAWPVDRNSFRSLWVKRD